MTEPASIHQWVSQRPGAEVRAALERLRRAEGVAAIAVMPDVHLASEVCVGVALATESRLLPAAVGSDIGCGMAALTFEAGPDRGLRPEHLRERGPRLLRAIARVVPIIRHRASAPVELPASLTERTLASASLEGAKQREARLQLGTLGRGNHFIELQADEGGRPWLMVHSGSRGIGQRIRKWHEARASPGSGGLRGIQAESEAGRAYLADLRWALDYAAENRARILRQVSAVLSAELELEPRPETLVTCEHNFVRLEVHRGRALWVHRKGAISARDGESGIIPGSMGSASYIVSGRGQPDSLCSSSHGAGRAMARGEARRRIGIKQLRREMSGVIFDERLVDRLRDEAPGAYKDIGAVMRAQRGLTRVVHRLRPLVAFKGA